MSEKCVRGKGPPLQPKVFSEEEWARINGHLTKGEANERDARNGSEKKEKLAPPDGVHKSLKVAHASKRTEREDWETAETIPKVESIRRRYQSEAKKEEILNRAKEILFENKDYSRRLLRGLKLSTVLHERNRQIEFNESLKKSMKMREREMRIRLMEEAEKYGDELRRKKEKDKEKMETFRRELDRQVSEKMEERRRGEVEKAKERRDLVKMKEELEAAVEEERLEGERRRRELKKDIAEYVNREKEIRQGLRMREKEQEEVNKIYQDVARKVDKIRREKEKAQFRKTKKLEIETVRDLKGTVTSNAGDEKLRQFLTMREARKGELLKDLLTGKKMAEEDMERRRMEDKAERKKSSLMRCRKDEADRARSQREREERRKAMKDTMRCYILQWMEKEEDRKREKEVDKFYAPDFTEENQLIARHCDEVLRLVKRYRRPMYPVAAAVKEVKREFGLDAETNQNFMKSNVPIGK